MKRTSHAAKYVDRRLSEVRDLYGLDERASGRLRALLEILAREDAPTTVHDPRRGVDIHIADSLAGLALPSLREAGTIADLGSGAGLPALALAAALPGVRVVAVESAARKAEFIRGAARELALSNVEVVIERAESWTDGRGACDVVCARALAALPVILEYAAPLLRVGGAAVAWKGRVSEEEAADGVAAAHVLGLERVAIATVDPLPGAERRTLHIYSKVMETPARFPRRPGIATKRPLSAKK